MAGPLLLLSLYFIFNLVSANLDLEDGYTVTTAIDGHKLNINPYAVLAQPRSSDLIVLDSTNSAFYTAPVSSSGVSEVKRFAGDGVSGYKDGESDRARFNKPRSFAVDGSGNLYVADKNNRVIRKISNSGSVTTIAGGYATGIGRDDGPAQNATFSSNFDLVFVSERCALLISDHGNQLIRQINLKAEDCARNSHSALTATSLWALGLGFSCLLGIAIGFAVRPYVFREVSNLNLSETWKPYLISLGKQVLILCFEIRNGVAKSKFYSITMQLIRLILSHLSLMFRYSTVNSHLVGSNDRLSSSEAGLSTVNTDLVSSQARLSTANNKHVQDLLSFDEITEQGEAKTNPIILLSPNPGKLDEMILANIDGFEKAGEMLSSSGLVRRR